MQHRTRVVQVTGGHAGICSCGFITSLAESATRDRAAIAINDHEVTAMRDGVKVTLDPAAETIKKR